jgi:hypothetical protein
VQVIGAAITRSLQARAHRGAAWCRSLAADVRALQLDALDQSVQAHLAGPAMHFADPLHESLFSQLEGCAEEGAQAPTTANAGLTPAQRAALAEADDDHWLLWLAPAGFAVGLIASAVTTWGRA